jgi:phage FluMu protein Com
MTIEFRCVNCNKLLRVNDEAAGKKAKCPECATVVEMMMTGQIRERA